MRAGEGGVSQSRQAVMTREQRGRAAAQTRAEEDAAIAAAEAGGLHPSIFQLNLSCV
jgi:hypothetical protein